MLPQVLATLMAVLDQLASRFARVLPRDPEELLEKRVLLLQRAAVAPANVVLNLAQVAQHVHLPLETAPALSRVTPVVPEIAAVVAPVADVIPHVAIVPFTSLVAHLPPVLPQLALAPSRLTAIRFEIVARLRDFAAQEGMDSFPDPLLRPAVPFGLRLVEARHQALQPSDVGAIAGELPSVLPDFAPVLPDFLAVSGQLPILGIGPCRNRRAHGEGKKRRPREAPTPQCECIHTTGSSRAPMRRNELLGACRSRTDDLAMYGN